MVTAGKAQHDQDLINFEAQVIILLKVFLFPNPFLIMHCCSPSTKSLLALETHLAIVMPLSRFSILDLYVSDPEDLAKQPMSTEIVSDNYLQKADDSWWPFTQSWKCLLGCFGTLPEYIHSSAVRKNLGLDNHRPMWQ